MRKKLLQEIDKLRNLYFLLQNLRGNGKTYIQNLYSDAKGIPRGKIPECLDSLRIEISEIKQRVGCRLTDAQIAKIVREMTVAQGKGYAYIYKRYIDKNWFTIYSEVFPRWSHIPGHALVVFDTDIEGNSPFAILLAEEQLFRDAKLIWDHIREIIQDGKDFKTRKKEKQRDLYSYMRTLATVTFHFLEAYLNGIAHNCFQNYHDSLAIEDHDLLSEWDSKEKRQRFVPFEKKLKKYPIICGKYLGRKLSIKADQHLDFLLTEGKAIRDAFTHPTPYTNKLSKDPSKTYRMLTTSPDQLKMLLESTIIYVQRIEKALGHDISQSVPWLQVDGLNISS